MCNARARVAAAPAGSLYLRSRRAQSTAPSRRAEESRVVDGCLFGDGHADIPFASARRRRLHSRQIRVSQRPRFISSCVFSGVNSCPRWQCVCAARIVRPASSAERARFLSLRDGLEVLRVDAGSVAAEVVKDQARGDRSDLGFVHEAVRQSAAPAVAGLVDSALPDQAAGRRLFNALPPVRSSGDAGLSHMLLLVGGPASSPVRAGTSGRLLSQGMEPPGGGSCGGAACDPAAPWSGATGGRATGRNAAPSAPDDATPRRSTRASSNAVSSSRQQRESRNAWPSPVTISHSPGTIGRDRRHRAAAFTISERAPAARSRRRASIKIGESSLRGETRGDQAASAECLERHAALAASTCASRASCVTMIVASVPITWCSRGVMRVSALRELLDGPRPGAGFTRRPRCGARRSTPQGLRP
jgi:hypothetical protein